MPEEYVDNETWKNDTPSDVFILKRNEDRKWKSIPVRSGMKVTLSTSDRLHNTERAHDPSVDSFSNGTFTPVRIIDAPDQAEIASNPNHVTEDEMKALFDLKAAEFKERIGLITNAVALQRIKAMADDEDSPVNAHLWQVKALDRRIGAITGQEEITEVNSVPTNTQRGKRSSTDFGF